MKTQADFDQAFPVQVNLPVQWGEMDAFNHVNNATYFKYFETARLAYFNQVGVMDDMQSAKIGPILAETSAKFRRPLVFPDSIVAGAGVLEHHEYGFLMQYGIWSEQQQTVVTLGTGRVVMVDYKTGQKVQPSEALKNAIKALQNNS
ncbi:thioesterase family protein [Marinicella sp. S1101]|uniref:acyl-CoA thioesterase n=1 Tax=Marinicella marina TaxID=2996016 RepID=UPI002260B801|nr:thioesterase family protein [Marinicella marina]MCX7553203.1 thioesterase family protein [Marinicella marina]MDJ1138935.1 thioesterase family protein [Marinicella marina]